MPDVEIQQDFDVEFDPQNEFEQVQLQTNLVQTWMLCQFAPNELSMIFELWKS